MRQVREGYKETEVGVIPEEWEVKKLGEILNIQTGKMNAQDSIEDGIYPFFTRCKEVQKINEYKYDTEALFIAGEGNFDVKYYKGKFNLHQRTYMLTAIKENVVDLKFMKNAIQPRIIRLVSTSVGSTVQSLRKPIIEELEVSIPPLPEQEKIADILSSVDEQIEAADEQIAVTKELKRGLMQKLLTKGIRHTKFKLTELGEIPEEWEVKKLGEVAKFQGGFAFKSGDYSSYGIKLVKITNVQQKNISWEDMMYLPQDFYNDYKSFRLYKNDIVMAMTRPIISTGIKVAMVKDEDMPSLLNQRVGRFNVSEKIEKSYIYHTCFSVYFIDKIRELCTATNQPNISGAQIENILIILPSLQEQQQIAEILSSVDEQIEVKEVKKSELQELKKGLMQKLLNGEIRVVK